ncbi:chemotaxis response regulator protein-glutamate methylesterase [Lampropedia puyangensis]|uniref:Protein-glutamate methylesterase/protein-glutamine glutaminase n=1 Tax=Lampropedia puyangensis TaxID=1330072 RepID=A0A4S8EWQ2_9BURK|nr:chemotaxis response regulator protein-glutamate methylesterase [Lampropedia puyangensis]THT98986.1 chemotaxis response regulator protein-glutamate methylesterase [Lampropedia puyangensis]
MIPASQQTNTPSSNLIRVLVVDDSALVRQLLKTIIDAQADMTCIAIAKHAEMAIRMASELRPDVMTLDVEMPGISGLQLLQQVMQSQPLPVVMISSQTHDGAQTTLTALELGAIDFVAKPSIGVADGLIQLAQEVVEKIRAAAHAQLPTHHTTNYDNNCNSASRSTPETELISWQAVITQPERLEPRQPSRPTPYKTQRHNTQPAPIKLIAIGASTGGTDAIRTILQALPLDCPPITIVQHMPAGFTRNFAERLDSVCSMHVCEAEEGQLLQRGHAYIAPGGKHLRVTHVAGNLYAQISEDSPVLRHRPSVDALFRSITRAIGAQHCIAALLTGMGTDGAAALLELKIGGAYTIAQDASTSIVYGMPREAAALGATCSILPLQHIGQAIVHHMKP